MFAKKSLGQNFLNSQSAIAKIVETGKVAKEDLILEIGPGRGALTKALLQAGAKVFAVEKDAELIPFLTEKFSPEIASGQLTLVHDDILNLDFSDFETYKLIANIPYYLTGQIIRYFLETKHQPKLMVLMLQKEVARRIVASNHKESLLSISVKAYADPKYIKTIPAGNFTPAPKVDSAILLIENIDKNNFQQYRIEEKAFFEILRRGFAQKRKLLKNNLSLTEEQLNNLGLSTNIRAEELTTNQWFQLAQKLA